MTLTETNKIAVYLPREIALSLLEDANILTHEDNIMPGVPNGVYYDTEADRWTWELDEATTWAIERIAGAR